MRKNVAAIFMPLLLVLLTGCGATGDKTGNLSSIYGITALLSLGILIGYCFAKKKSSWFLLLLSSVLVVNLGYYMLAVSGDLRQALTANRVAYLGSVFLPLSMWMIICRVVNIRCPRWVSGLLLGVSIAVFLVAASPGYLDIYYKTVTFEKLNGVTVMHKTYGPLHGLYMIYLLGYFAAMVTSILYGAVKHRTESVSYAVILAVAVFINIGVWLIEQFIDIRFEILSVSYIISEAFLLGLHFLMAEAEKKKPMPQPAPMPAVPPATVTDPAEEAQLELFLSGLDRLTPKEKELYDCYISGMSTADIMEQLNIKENTLKFHNKNLYSKLGVSSRKQMLRLAAARQKKTDQ